jgi:hypothetical protein
MQSERGAARRLCNDFEDQFLDDHLTSRLYRREASSTQDFRRLLPRDRRDIVGRLASVVPLSHTACVAQLFRAIAMMASIDSWEEEKTDEDPNKEPSHTEPKSLESSAATGCDQLAILRLTAMLN